MPFIEKKRAAEAYISVAAVKDVEGAVIISCLQIVYVIFHF